jgi:sec-independent protein translocase protein TatA
MGFFSAPGPLEIMVILAIALIVLGPSRLPDAARSVGKGMREFRETLSGINDEPEEDPYDDDELESEPYEDEDEPEDVDDEEPAAEDEAVDSVPTKDS